CVFHHLVEAIFGNQDAPIGQDFDVAPHGIDGPSLERVELFALAVQDQALSRGGDQDKVTVAHHPGCGDTEIGLVCKDNLAAPLDHQQLSARGDEYVAIGQSLTANRQRDRPRPDQLSLKVALTYLTIEVLHYQHAVGAHNLRIERIAQTFDFP